MRDLRRRWQRVAWLAVLLCLAPLRASAAPPAESPPAETPADGSPWLDLAPAPLLPPIPTKRDHKLASGLAVAGIYLGFSAWAYIAWYRNHPEKSDPQSIGDIWACGFGSRTVGCDGWFGKKTYAGGADKLGHAWATMTLARGGTAALRAGGWDRTRSALVSALLSEGLFFAVEMKDYYYYEFSAGDFTMDTVGALAALALDLSPRLDELFDFRVEYWPSKQYRFNLTNADSPCAKRTPGQPSCSRWNVAEDYSGETYLLAMHLGGIHTLRDWRYGGWSKYVDVSLGFASRNYKPPPTLLGDDPVRTQRLFLGVSVNAQGIIDALLPHDSKVRKAGHGLFEVLTPPLTIPVFGGERSTRDVASDGA